MTRASKARQIRRFVFLLNFSSVIALFLQILQHFRNTYIASIISKDRFQANFFYQLFHIFNVVMAKALILSTCAGTTCAHSFRLTNFQNFPRFRMRL